MAAVRAAVSASIGGKHRSDNHIFGRHGKGVVVDGDITGNSFPPFQVITAGGGGGQGNRRSRHSSGCRCRRGAVSDSFHCHGVLPGGDRQGCGVAGNAVAVRALHGTTVLIAIHIHCDGLDHVAAAGCAVNVHPCGSVVPTYLPLPGQTFIGSIGRLHRGCQGSAVGFLQGQACLVQFHAGNRNNHRFINAQSKFPAVKTIIVSCFHNERTSPFCRRCAGNHTGTCVQAQAFRQGTAGDTPCDRSRTLCQKSCAVRCLCSAVWQTCCCNCGRILYTAPQAVLYPFVQCAAIHDHIVAIGVQACPIIQCQALTLANDQILL